MPQAGPNIRGQPPDMSALPTDLIEVRAIYVCMCVWVCMCGYVCMYACTCVRMDDVHMYV